MKTLLLQVRDHADAEAQEVFCFSEALGERSRPLVTHNLVKSPAITWSDVRDADLLLLGGAGKHSVTQEYAFTPYLDEVLDRWIASRRCFFGSCYGHHILARLYGAEIVEDPETEEIGTFDVSLTEEGKVDPLFAGLPDRFPAHLGHHDRVAQLPAALIELARSERCAYQALRLRERPVYSTQFHPEITVPQMRERLMIYRRSYLGPKSEWAALMASLRPTPESAQLLRRFVEIYF